MLMTALQSALAPEHVRYLVGRLDWICIAPAYISTVPENLWRIFECKRPEIRRDLKLPRRNNDMAVNERRHGLPDGM